MSILVALGLVEPSVRVRIAPDGATVCESADDVRVIPASGGAAIRYWIDVSEGTATLRLDGDHPSIMLAAFDSKRAARRALADVVQGRVGLGAPVKRGMRWPLLAMILLGALWLFRPAAPASNANAMPTDARMTVHQGVSAPSFPPVSIVGIPDDSSAVAPMLPADVTCSGVQ